VPHRLAAAAGSGTDVLFVHTLMQSETSTLCVGAPSSRTTAALPAAHRTVTPRGDRT
jgi:hypothetical protein